jgi:O-antigen ligase
MQSLIALIIFSLFIIGLLIIDCRMTSNVSKALWVPLIWLAILASRPIGGWLSSVGTQALNQEDGSPVDSIILLALISGAIVILFKRKLCWKEWLRTNTWLCLLFLYFGISIFWSDFPLISFKRWIRAVGSLTMILVVLSEDSPIISVKTLIRRCVYILIPASILLIKYYPDMAVSYNQFTGEEYLIGVTTDKNALGRLCIVSGIFLLWNILISADSNNFYNKKQNRFIDIILLFTTLWLLFKSKSSTSLACLAIGYFVLISLGVPLIRRNIRHIGSFIILTVFGFWIVEFSFNLTESIVTNVLHRNMTFTDRTYIWNDLLDRCTNPLFGVGYDSFWLGKRFDFFMHKHQVFEAHNGYLEAYAEVGITGLLLFMGFLSQTFWKAKKSLVLNFDYGRLRLILLFIFLFYNITEASYKITTLLCFVFVLVAIDAPKKLQSQISEGSMTKPKLFESRYNRYVLRSK